MYLWEMWTYDMYRIALNMLKYIKYLYKIWSLDEYSQSRDYIRIVLAVLDTTV